MLTSQLLWICIKFYYRIFFYSLLQRDCEIIPWSHQQTYSLPTMNWHNLGHSGQCSFLFSPPSVWHRSHRCDRCIMLWLYIPHWSGVLWCVVRAGMQTSPSLNSYIYLFSGVLSIVILYQDHTNQRIRHAPWKDPLPLSTKGSQVLISLSHCFIASTICTSIWV